MKKLLKIISIAILLIITGCQSVESDLPAPASIKPTIGVTVQSEMPAATPAYSFETPVPGTATIHGTLLVLDPMLTRPADDDALFLVPLEGEAVMAIPPFVVGEVPQADVNEINGEFVFTGIKPGQYAVVVLTSGGIQIPARFYENGNIAIINVKEADIDQTIELDYLSH